MSHKALDPCTGRVESRQAHQLAVLYINSKYWGLYNIREKIHPDFLVDNHNVSAGSVDLLVGNSMVVGMGGFAAGDVCRTPIENVPQFDTLLVQQIPA